MKVFETSPPANMSGRLKGIRTRFWVSAGRATAPSWSAPVPTIKSRSGTSRPANKRKITGHARQQVTSVQFHRAPPEPISCSSSGDKTVRLHHASTATITATLQAGTRLPVFCGGGADGSLIAAGGEDGVLRLWDGTTGKSLATFGPPPPTKDATQAAAAKALTSPSSFRKHRCREIGGRPSPAS